MYLVGEIVLRTGVQALRATRVDDCVQHLRIRRIQRARPHDTAIGVGIPVGDPVLGVMASPWRGFSENSSPRKVRASPVKQLSRACGCNAPLRTDRKTQCIA